MVEAGRVELPSENPSTRLSTSVAVVLKFPFRGSRRQDPRSGSFINPVRLKALTDSFPTLMTPDSATVGLRGLTRHCLCSGESVIVVVSSIKTVPVFNEARGFGSLIRHPRSPSKPGSPPNSIYIISKNIHNRNYQRRSSFMRLSISRSASRSAMEWRLSYSFLPFAEASSTFTLPSFK